MKKLWFALALLSGFYLLSPLYQTSYISDDSYNSLMRGQLLHNGMTVWQFMWGGVDYWLFKAGRVFPLPNYYVPLYYFLSSVLVYKILTVTVALMGVWALAWFVSLVTRSAEAGWVIVWAMPALFQLRVWHDPLLAFHFMIPLVCLFLMLSLAFFQRALDRGFAGGDRRWSAFFFFWALMTYEIALPCVVFFAVLGWRAYGFKWRALRVIWPHGLLCFAFIVTTFLLRSALNPRYNNSYEVIASFNWADALKASAMQMTASLPLSYTLKRAVSLKPFFEKSDFVFFPIYAWGLWRALSRLSFISRADWLGWLSVPILLGMGLIGGFSSHQKEILGVGWGMGYLPVLLGYYGSGLALASLGLWIYSRWNTERARLVQRFVFVVFGLGIAGSHLAQNRAVAHEANQFYKFPREVLFEALNSGILSEVPEEATIVIQGRFPSDHFWAFSQLLGKKVFVLSPAQLVERRRQIGRPHGNARSGKIIESLVKQNYYGVAYQYDREQGRLGTVFAGRIEQIVWTDTQVEPLVLGLSELRVHSHSPHHSRLMKPEQGQGINLMTLVKEQERVPVAIESFELKPYLYSKETP